MVRGESLSQLPVEDSFVTDGGPGEAEHGGQHMKVLCVKPNMQNGQDWHHKCCRGMESTQDPRYDSFILQTALQALLVN